MSTATIRIDDALRERIARVADATDQTPHSFMVQALTEKVVEAEWKLAVQGEARRRDQALRVREDTPVEWHDMKAWLQQRLDEGAAKPAPRKRRA